MTGKSLTNWTWHPTITLIVQMCFQKIKRGRVACICWPNGLLICLANSHWREMRQPVITSDLLSLKSELCPSPQRLCWSLRCNGAGGGPPLLWELAVLLCPNRTCRDVRLTAKVLAPQDEFITTAVLLAHHAKVWGGKTARMPFSVKQTGCFLNFFFFWFHLCIPIAKTWHWTFTFYVATNILLCC